MYAAAVLTFWSPAFLYGLLASVFHLGDGDAW
jgi:hypothetical protein